MRLLPSIKLSNAVLALLLLVSVFKNISYPLMWADESVTAVLAGRVTEYGYPKVHDGKNVVNDAYCVKPEFSVNPKDDAYIGISDWGQFYFGTIGYLLAAKTGDMYAQTAIFRSTFAIVGLLGLFLLGYFISRLFEEPLYKNLFLTLFLLAELISVSIILHLREVRYYSPTLLFSALIICLYAHHRFRNKSYTTLKTILYSVTLACLLWVVFTMFSPMYFIFLAAIGLSEAAIGSFHYLKSRNLKESLLGMMSAAIALGASLLAVYPLLQYFKTFEKKQLMDSYFHFSSAVYGWHISDEFRYFSGLELLWLAIVMRVLVLANRKKALAANPQVFNLSGFLTLLFVVFILSVPCIDSPIFTRYLIYMQPVLAALCIADFLVLVKIFSQAATRFWNTRVYIVTSLFVLLFGLTFAHNIPYISGHFYEMTHIYKGPLDFTIPHIKEMYPDAQKLTIATNYEETSFMYYLKSKVIVGNIANNMPEDTTFQPDIISYRQTHQAGYLDRVFDIYLRRAPYKKIRFLCQDMAVNNIPELNYETTVYRHCFQTVYTDEEARQEFLLIKI